MTLPRLASLLCFSSLALGCSEEAPAGSGGSSGGGAAGSAAGGASGSGPLAGMGGSEVAGQAGIAGSAAGTAGAGVGGAGGDGGGAGGDGGGAAGSGGSAPTWGVETRPTGQTCIAPPSQSGAAMLLSQTGCVNPTSPTEPAATLIPYAVSSPLWSDAAEKARYFALPDAGMIRVKDCARTPAECMPPEQGGTYEDEGDWSFPIGTVFVKTFAFGGRLIETRLLVRAGEFDYWGYSYQWRADQSDADLLASNIEGYDAEVEGPNGPQTWHFPSRQQCLQCHTTPAGVYLGPETAQLDIDFAYPNGVTGNQVDTLEHIGVFEAPPARNVPYPDPADTSAPITERARSYLHSNCGMCHRPGSNFTGFDARFSTPFADMTLCNEPPEKGDLGISGALKLVPGDAASSVLSLRMKSLDPMFRMPQIGTRVVDDAGVSVIDAWIESLTSCP